MIIRMHAALLDEGIGPKDDDGDDMGILRQAAAMMLRADPEMTRHLLHEDDDLVRSAEILNGGSGR